jgi:hypothetical protein
MTMCLDVQRDSLTRSNITMYVCYYMIFFSFTCIVSLSVPRALNCVFKEPWKFSVY